MLLVDLKFYDARNEETATKQAAIWVSVWVSLAVAFGIGLLVMQGTTLASEYFAGYLIEYSLSVDNMFVFVVIFGYFGIRREYQHEILFFGILGAMIFRGLFIVAGLELIERFAWIIYIFGAFLIYSSIKIARGGAEDVHPEENPVLKFFQRHFPTTTAFDGVKFFIVENAKRVATPLAVTLLVVETTDIVFAVDSIPAIFGVTQDPFIILTSNIFAILGLRSLYFLLAGAMDRLHLLRYGLGAILGFVGVKMLLEAVHVEVPIWLSLLFIVSALAITATWSLRTKPPPKDDEEAEVAAGDDGQDENDDGRGDGRSPGAVAAKARPSGEEPEQDSPRDQART
ncbi:MAG: TerC family protein [Actinobacteria bacterium]|nr:TerC family protein [Actinomycetota bacterium]